MAEPLKADGGHKLVVAALENLVQAAMLGEQQKFDDFFKRSVRRRGQVVTDTVRENERMRNDLRQLDQSTLSWLTASLTRRSFVKTSVH